MSPGTSITYILIATLAGIGIPVMAALNSTLGMRLANPAMSTFILFLVGLLISTVALMISGLPLKSQFETISFPYYLGGIFVAFYVLAITWIAPRFGVGNAVFFVLLGQLISAAIIDHFGLLGANQVPLDMKRIIGLVLMAIGVYLSRRVG